MRIFSPDHSPCDVCVHHCSQMVLGSTYYDPKELDESCELGMSNFGSNEGCYRFEEE